MKKTGRIKCQRPMLVSLLYALAAFAIVIADPPQVVVLLSGAALFISWYRHEFIVDDVTNVSVLNDKQLLVTTRRGRWVPLQLTGLYYSVLGQVLYCRQSGSAVSARYGTHSWVVAKLLPGDPDSIDSMRNIRCQCLRQLAAEPQTGDSTVSFASGSRSGTSMLK